ncbi:MAG: alpha/beta hydrolase [Candidatus Parcubacteria bacterium]|nr:alpha/beta hydrolase [Burkholderiales bacterium]
MSRLLLFAVLALPGAVPAQEIVTLATREGVTQSFFIAAMGGVKPQAAALLFIGGGGNIRLRMEDGKPRFGALNFLPRSRGEFIRNGILPVIMDNPSDQQGSAGMSDGFRESAAHAADVRAVLAEVKRRHPGIPVYLVGTSRSTISGAHLGRALADEVAGVVLSASMFYVGRRAVLAAFDFSSIPTPLLFVHHRDDACESTPFRDAGRLGAKFPLVAVNGGKPPESGPCDPLAPHGFFGREAETVDAIAAWMLKNPYRKEID